MSRRLGILVSHPIQYYTPWFRHLAELMEIEVLYAHKQDGKGQARAGFGVEFEWDIPLLEGYPHRWLHNVATNPSVGNFNGLDTPELFELIQPQRYKAFLLFSWNRRCSWQAIRACRKAQIPLLMRGDSHLQSRRSRITSLTKYLPYRAFLPRLDAHLYVGKRNLAYLRHYGVSANRLFFSPHFVDTEFFARTAADARLSGRAPALRKKLGISSSAFVFLFVGKLISQKNPLQLVDAFKTLLTQNSSDDSHLVFVGSGPELTSLQDAAATIRHRVHFVGFRNQTELPDYYQMANALVLPSYGETWGLVVNEAFACGLPAVISDGVGCAPDLIDQDTGFIYQSNDVSGLVEKMGEVKEQLARNHRVISARLEQKSNEYSIAAATKGLQQALHFLYESQHRSRKVSGE